MLPHFLVFQVAVGQSVGLPQKSHPAPLPPLPILLTLPSSTHRLISLPPALPSSCHTETLGCYSCPPPSALQLGAFDPVCRSLSVCCPRSSGPWLAVPLLAVAEKSLYSRGSVSLVLNLLHFRIVRLLGSYVW